MISLEQSETFTSDLRTPLHEIPFVSTVIYKFFIFDNIKKPFINI